MDGRNTVGNHTRRVILISKIKIKFRAAKYIEQSHQTLESIVTSNKSSTTHFLETSKDHIYITSGRIWTVKIQLEIIKDVLILFLSSKLCPDQPNTSNGGTNRSNKLSLLISHPPLLFVNFKGPYLFHFWSDLDGISTVGNHTRRVILIYELKTNHRRY